MKSKQELAKLLHELFFAYWEFVGSKGNSYPWRENNELVGFVDSNFITFQTPYESKMTEADEAKLKADVCEWLLSEGAEQPLLLFGYKGFGKYREITVAYHDRLKIS